MCGHFSVTSILTNRINNFHGQPIPGMVYFDQEKVLIVALIVVNNADGSELTPFRGTAWAGGPAMNSSPGKFVGSAGVGLLARPRHLSDIH